MKLADEIALFSALGGWFSAIATVAAVCASLYIANRRPRISFSCLVSEATLPIPKEVAERFSGQRKVILIIGKITNQSSHQIRIYSVGLIIKGKVSFLRYLYGWDEFPLPQVLNYGEDHNVIFSDNACDWIKGMKDTLRENDLRPEEIRCLVTLSTGKRRSFPLDKKLIAKLKDN